LLHRQSVLLLGGSGFLGSAMRRAMGMEVAVWTYHENPASDGRSRSFDASSTPVKDLIAGLRGKPDAAIVLFGRTSIDFCARHPLESAKVNVQGAVRVVDELRELGIMPVFVSSDAVFDGSRSWSREDDPVRPILTYGKQKLEVEQHIAALPPPWLVVRLPKLVSENGDPRCMLTQWMKQLQAQEEILCATDQFFTPAAAADVAGAIRALIRNGAQGLFHLGGAQRLSRRDLLSLLVEEYGRHKSVRTRIVDCLLKDLNFAEERPRDTSMRSDKARKEFQYEQKPLSTVVQAAVAACERAS